CPLVQCYHLHSFVSLLTLLFFFFFNDPSTTEIYTLSLHDALPIYPRGSVDEVERAVADDLVGDVDVAALGVPGLGLHEQQIAPADRKSTRLNSSHVAISYAVFCLKKKKKTQKGYNTHIGTCSSANI